MSYFKVHHGYDAVFISDVWEDLKCVVCSLVLRTPLQISECGHRLCKGCFENMKEYSKRLNTKLLCPMDRNVVDIDKVFDDKGMARAVRNLKVKCGEYEQGCEWTGDLGDLEEHESMQCVHRVKVSQHPLSLGKQESEMFGLYQDLLMRVQRCEDQLITKDKDIAHLKFTVKEIKEDSVKKEEELKGLKTLNTDLHEKIKVLEELHSPQKDCEKLKDCISEVDIKLKDNINEIEEQLESTREELDSTIGRNTKEIQMLKNNVRNLENLKFTCDIRETRVVVFNWVLDDFEYHRNSGELVRSPVFFTQVDGYRFNLCARCTGPDNNNLSLYLLLNNGERDNEPILDIPPLNREYVLEILDNYGGSKRHKVTTEDQTPRACTIPHGRTKAETFCGIKDMLIAPFDNYVINNSMYFKCTLLLFL